MKFILRLVGAYLNFLSIISPKLAGKHGYYVFCYPSKISLKKSQAEYLNDHKYFDFEFEGNRINLYRWGHGPKRILLLHGWTSNSYRWRRYIESYDMDKYTFFAIDAPGHGLSGGTFLNLLIYGKLINHVLMEIENIDTVIGHSMGAFASLFSFYEFENPEINKLILMGTPGEVLDFVDFFNKALGLNDRVFKYVIDYFESTYAYTFKYFSATKFAKEIDLEGLIIHDTKDREVPVHHGRSISNVWTKAEYIETTGKGHKLNDDEVKQWIKKYIESENKQKSRMELADELIMENSFAF